MKRATHLSYARTPKRRAEGDKQHRGLLRHLFPRRTLPTMNLRSNIVAQSFIPLYKAHLLA